MPFSYYNRLTASDKKVYRQSDRIAVIQLPPGESFQSMAVALAQALKNESRDNTQAQAQALLNAMTDGLKVPRIRVNVLLKRPSN